MKVKNTLLLAIPIIVISFHACTKDENVNESGNGKLPTLTTTPITNISGISAVSGGNITLEGSSTVTARGVCWSTGNTTTISDSKSTDGAGVGTFVSSLTNLNGNTTYFVRAYATNATGTGYGMAVSFKTFGNIPAVATLDATNINSSGANLNGTIKNNLLSTVVTFEYGTTMNYGTSVTASPSPVADTNKVAVTFNLTGLTLNTEYHYRIKAVNSAGTSYGDDKVFTTTLTVTDADGNTYNTVKIGDQTWMQENLRTTKYSDGSPINYINLIEGRNNLLTGWTNDDFDTFSSSNTDISLASEGANTTGNAHCNSIHFLKGDYLLAKINVTLKSGDLPVVVIYRNSVRIVEFPLKNGQNDILYESISDDIYWITLKGKNTSFSASCKIYNIDNNVWFTDVSGAFGWYNDDIIHKTPYGGLYNWYAITNTRSICPTGWHVPTDEDWKKMESYLGMSSSDLNSETYRQSGSVGNKIRETGTIHWASPNTATNSSGFTALPNGRRSQYGLYYDFGNGAYFWSSTPYTTIGGWARTLNNGPQVYRGGLLLHDGGTVRCLKN